MLNQPYPPSAPAPTISSKRSQQYSRQDPTLHALLLATLHRQLTIYHAFRRHQEQHLSAARSRSTPHLLDPHLTSSIKAAISRVYRAEDLIHKLSAITADFAEHPAKQRELTALYDKLDATGIDLVVSFEDLTAEMDRLLMRIDVVEEEMEGAFARARELTAIAKVVEVMEEEVAWCEGEMEDA